MIIRSQDKKRIANINTCHLIAIVDTQGKSKNITVDGMVIGEYSSEEKAIKVFDMIQNEYFTHMTVVDNERVTVGILERPKVFQMPQDSEV